MDDRPAPRQDESGEAVKSRFYTFLTSFVSEADVAISEAAPHQRGLRNTYEEQIVAMIRNDKTTVYVNFADMNAFDRELAEAIQLEYYRFEPYLKQAVQDYVGVEHRDYVQSFVNILPTSPETGGNVIVPLSHRVYKQLAEDFLDENGGINYSRVAK